MPLTSPVAFQSTHIISAEFTEFDTAAIARENNIHVQLAFDMFPSPEGYGNMSRA